MMKKTDNSKGELEKLEGKKNEIIETGTGNDY